MKKMTALLLASVMIVSLAACGGNDDDDAASSGPGTQITAAEEDETEATHTIKIGVFEPTTGENSNGGKQEVLGIRYANAIVPTVELNGTVYRIELVEADNQSDKVAGCCCGGKPDCGRRCRGNRLLRLGCFQCRRTDLCGRKRACHRRILHKSAGNRRQ